MKSSQLFTLPLASSSFDYSPYYSNSKLQASSTYPGSSSTKMKVRMGTRSYTRNNHEPSNDQNNQVDFISVKLSSNNSNATITSDCARLNHNVNSSTSSSDLSQNNKCFFPTKSDCVPRSLPDSNDSLQLARSKINNKTSKNDYPEISLIFSPSDFQKSYKTSNPIRPSSLPLSLERKLHDKYFLILFVLFISISLSVFLYSNYIRKTNVNFILNGHDDWGNVCGERNKPIKGAIWSGQNMINRQFMLLRLGRNNTMNSICIENCTFNDYFKTPFNRCFPKPLLLNSMFKVLNVTKSFLEEIIVDSVLCWREIVFVCSLAIAFSFCLLILMGFFVGILIWVILISLCIFLVFACLYFWLNWYFMIERGIVFANTKQNRMIILNEKSKESWLMISIVSTIITTILIILIIYLKKSLRLASLLFKEAGKAIASMPLILVLPFFTLICLFGVFYYSTISIIHLKSIQYPVVKINSTLVEFKTKPLIKYLIWFDLAVFLWMIQFLFSCQYYVISASIVKWYFRSKNIHCPIFSSIIELIKYHIGSLALGSLLVTGIKLFRVFLNKIESILRTHEKNVSILAKFYKYILWFIEKLIIYINKNSYIIMAIHGTNYSKSTQIAFKLLISKSVKAAFVNVFCDFLLFISKIAIVIVTILVGLECIKDKEEKLNYPWGPLCIPIIFSYIISHCFLTVYEIAIDTLFVCFCEDSKLEEIESQSTDSNIDLNQNWSLMSRKNSS